MKTLGASSLLEDDFSLLISLKAFSSVFLGGVFPTKSSKKGEVFDEILIFVSWSFLSSILSSIKI